jgi:hypothetical protein
LLIVDQNSIRVGATRIDTQPQVHESTGLYGPGVCAGRYQAQYHHLVALVNL